MSRIFLAAFVLLGLLLPSTRVASGQGPSPWPTTTLEEQGFDSNAMADVLLGLHEDIPALHSLLLIRDGKVAVDASFYPYDGSTPHELASVTKSVMTTLIAIAADEGYLELDQPMLDFFPDREVASVDDRKERVTVADLASMTGGLDCAWQPDEPTLDEMRAADDWIQFALDRPMVAEPGERWEYCSPDMHLLSAILTEATGMTALDFGWRYLFGPLGMREVIWPADPQGYSHGWGDIYLYPRDAAKLGQLWLNGGTWEGQRIVSEAWVTAAVQPISRTSNPDDDYGYGWWVDHESEVGGEFRASGRSGNYVIVYPALEIIVVTTGGSDFSSGDVTDRIGAVLVDPAGPIPANAEGAARLDDVIAELAEPPPAEAVPALPAVATEVSGVTWTFPASPLTIERLAVTFDGSAEATLAVDLQDQPPLVARIGLDGAYRFTPFDYGFPLALRGAWVDEDTFVIEWTEVANRDTVLLEATFTGDTVTVSSREVTHQDVMQVEGTAVPGDGTPQATPT
jgi:CubicO group peptidase (beta-lactamase class C family)